MRMHIAKSLQTRCKAIQHAGKTYNAAAASLSPPRPPLDWSRVASFNFLKEFTRVHSPARYLQQHPQQTVEQASNPQSCEALTLFSSSARGGATSAKDHLLTCIHQVYVLRGYTGVKGLGT
ncbi:hypothetical protein BC835DRAFT_1051220 [Cytidiella melzeri]|nr:hypothetical protein BC835DRAFT_1051220 [Cytidiella melzeri]